MVPDIAKKGHSFDGALKYYLHDKRQEGGINPTTSERVAWTETRNLMTDDTDTARQIMIATALQSERLKKEAGVKSTGRKSNAHVYAYSLAWHPDEAQNLDKAQMMEAVDQSLKALEAEHLQGVVVCHTDQKHPHVHVILNRVNQQDGRMHPFKNDRLILSDWANQYERDRGQILTPAREEKRKKREQNPDQEKRQEYAKQKRAEVEAQSKDKLNPAQMLKDLGEAKKVEHRQQWQDLSQANKSRREKIYADYNDRIKKASQLHRMENKPQWRDYFAEEQEKRKAFEQREKALFGPVINAVHATAIQHMNGQIDGRGKLSATFENLIDKQKRLTAFDEKVALDRDQMRKMINAPLDKQVGQLKLERRAELRQNRVRFDMDRQALIDQQNADWGKIREGWQQLKGRNYKPYQKRSADPVDKDWKKTAPKPIDQPKPKPQPTRTAVVSTPVPSPAPSGEVPRVNAKAQTVPRPKDWGKAKVEPKKDGLEGVRPVRKDWQKSKPTVSKAVPKPKDWQKPSTRTGDTVNKSDTIKKDWQKKTTERNYDFTKPSKPSEVKSKEQFRKSARDRVIRTSHLNKSR